jgi:5-methylcytosine-specific restriction protein B
LEKDGTFVYLVSQNGFVLWEMIVSDFATEVDYASKDWGDAFWKQPTFSDYRTETQTAKVAFLVVSIRRLPSPVPLSGIRWWKDYQAPTRINLQPFAEWNPEMSIRDHVQQRTGAESVAGQKLTAVNRILFGPPGTGKTWSSLVHAVALADRKPRTELRARWKTLVEADHIRFVTFHPAMTYEDFVEGLKPFTTTDGQVTYETTKGVLRELCSKAVEGLSGERITDRFEAFLEAASETEQVLTTSTGKKFRVTYPGARTFQCTPDSAPDSRHPVNLEVVKKLIAGEVSKHYNPSYARGIAEHIKRQGPLAESKPGIDADYVLVIDEINRGNIPAIFGELITLLEPDKRLGQSEELQVMLPGSRDRFGIPSNLHVLGTMNTADRSVEALDVALRRRFEFVETPPNPEVLEEVVEGLSLRLLLTKINERLEALIDRDHTIGHAFLIGVTDLDGLNRVFQNKIIPLLQEFFYSEWEKIGMVLGAHFVAADTKRTELFAKGFGKDYEVPEVYRLKPGPWDIEAFQAIVA